MKTLEEMSINERIIHFRKLMRFTQTEMAERLGIKCSSYSQLERIGKITCERLIEISKILDVDILFLLFGKEEEVRIATQNKEELERYKKRYSFFEVISTQELKLIKDFCYLSKQKRYSLYEKSLKMKKR